MQPACELHESGKWYTHPKFKVEGTDTLHQFEKCPAFGWNNVGEEKPEKPTGTTRLPNQELRKQLREELEDGNTSFDERDVQKLKNLDSVGPNHFIKANNEYYQPDGARLPKHWKTEIVDGELKYVYNKWASYNKLYKQDTYPTKGYEKFERPLTREMELSYAFLSVLFSLWWSLYVVVPLSRREEYIGSIFLGVMILIFSNIILVSLRLPFSIPMNRKKRTEYMVGFGIMIVLYLILIISSIIKISELWDAPFGVKWADKGTSEPKDCSMLSDSDGDINALSTALTDRITNNQPYTFTRVEWARFRINNLGEDSCIAVGNHYFQPYGTRPLAIGLSGAAVGCILVYWAVSKLWRPK